MTSERLIALVMSRFDPFRRGAETPKGDCPRVRPARQGTGIICITNHAILPTSTKQAPHTTSCLLRPLLSSSFDALWTRRAFLSRWRFATHVPCHHVAIGRQRLFDARGVSPLASFVLTRKLSCGGFQTRTAFRREWRLSFDALWTRRAVLS